MNKFMVLLLCAAVYGAALWVTSGLVLIPGVTWIRPANALTEIFGACFGLWGAAGVAIGNSLSDLVRGQLIVTTLPFILILEFLFTAAIIYWGVTDPSLRSWRGKIEWLVFAVVLQGLLTGFGISFGGAYIFNAMPQDLAVPIGWTITFNEALPAIPAGVIQYFLFPQMVKRGLWLGRDLNKSNVPREYLAELRK